MTKTQLLVLGGGSFVGWAVAEEGVRRGWQVTCATRGGTSLPAGTRWTRLDRTAPGAEDLVARLTSEADAMVDTWSGAADVVEAAAGQLAQGGARVCYVSSRSVYRSPLPPDHPDGEAWPKVDVAPPAPAGDYAVRKRRAERAYEAALPGSAILLRPGVVLGPRENLGRSSWWYAALNAARPVLAGPPDLAVQVIDVRDLATFALDRLTGGDSGAFDVAAPPVTLGSFAATFEAITRTSAAPRWLNAHECTTRGLEPWRDYPLWVPADHPTAGFFKARCERARAAGLRTRPLNETVADWHADRVERAKEKIPPRSQTGRTS